MTREHLLARDIRDARVLQAMGSVPRHLFVPEDHRRWAYIDNPLPIGQEQTISQPYIVAFMTQVLKVEPGDKVLEIGTGSGYQAAILAEIAKEVFSIEIIPELSERAAALLKELEYSNVWVRTGDGYFGWPEEAPFDGILVTAASGHVPQNLVDQLDVEACLVLPVGNRHQELIRITRTDSGLVTERLLPVRFVPMTGVAQE